MSALLEYAPMRLFDVRESQRVYRRYSYGPLLDLFVLDMRSYRGPNSANLQTTPSDATAFLGREQLDWLKAGLKNSRTVWKVVAADMPLGLNVGDGTTPGGQPRWEAERGSLMSAAATGRLVILSGPSCVGKSPLSKAIARFHPQLWNRLAKLVLFNSRAPRPGEIDGEDYHFRTRDQIEALKADPRCAVLDVRGDQQALNIQELEALLVRSDAFFEGNPFVGRLLHTHPLLADVNRLSVFLSPVIRFALKRPSSTWQRRPS